MEEGAALVDGTEFMLMILKARSGEGFDSCVRRAGLS